MQPGNDEPTISPVRNPCPDEPTIQPVDSFSTAMRPGSEGTWGLPKSFGRYRVVSLLGKGGFGAVYRAVDDQLERDVTIKVTLGSLLDPSMREGFLTEARIVAALDHPNIVPVCPAKTKTSSPAFTGAYRKRSHIHLSDYGRMLRTRADYRNHR